MKRIAGYTNADGIVIAGATLCLLACGYFLLFDDNLLFTNRLSNRQTIGRLTSHQNDARHRSNNSLAWYAAKDSQAIGVGDGVFSGENSSAVVELQGNGTITVGSMSMVVFSEIAEQKLANLETGNFRIKVDGTLKIAIRGEIATLAGQNSEVQIYMDKSNQPKIRLINGHATIQIKQGETISLVNSQEISSLEISSGKSFPPLATDKVQPNVSRQENQFHIDGRLLSSKPSWSEGEHPADPSRVQFTRKGVSVRKESRPMAAKSVVNEPPHGRTPTSVDSGEAVTAKIPNNRISHREFRQNHSLSLGTGLTYMTYSDGNNDNQTHVNYSSVRAPSWSLEGQYLLSDRWRLLGAIRNQVGEVSNSKSIQVEGSSYSWTIYSGEALLTPGGWKFSFFGCESSAGVRGGLQQHSMPFLEKVSSAEINMTNEPVTMATIGPHIDIRLGHSTDFEGFLRYQYPLVSSPALKINPGLTFDGSVGVTTMLTQDWTFGGYFLGQMQNYSYNSNSTFGTQQVFFSTVEGRVGYIFP